MRNTCTFIFIFFLICNLCFAQTETLVNSKIIRENGKFGIVDLETGTIPVKPVYDTIIQPYRGAQYYIIKNNNQYAYCIKQSKDSLYSNWVLSNFEFDSLFPIIGDYDKYFVGKPRRSYSLIPYLKGKKKGVIAVEHEIETDGGIFTLITYIVGVGEIIVYPAIYDNIIKDNSQKKSGENDDPLLVTENNGRYGFIDFGNDYEIKPQFETAPVVYDKYKRYVRSNNKWGVIEIIPDLKQFNYLVPCFCKGLESSGEYFYCRGTDDTLKIFNTQTKEMFTPLINNKVLMLDFYTFPDEPEPAGNFSKGDIRSTNLKGKDGAYYEISVFNNPNPLLVVLKAKNSVTTMQEGPLQDSLSNLCEYRSYSLANSASIIDLSNNKLVKHFSDTTAFYEIIPNYLILKVNIDPKTGKQYREFYSVTKGELIFKIKSTDKLFWALVEYDNYPGTPTHIDFKSGDFKTKINYRGHYNIKTGSYSKSKYK